MAGLFRFRLFFGSFYFILLYGRKSEIHFQSASISYSNVAALLQSSVTWPESIRFTLVFINVKTVIADVWNAGSQLVKHWKAKSLHMKYATDKSMLA